MSGSKRASPVDPSHSRRQKACTLPKEAMSTVTVVDRSMMIVLMMEITRVVIYMAILLMDVGVGGLVVMRSDKRS